MASIGFPGRLSETFFTKARSQYQSPGTDIHEKVVTVRLSSFFRIQLSGKWKPCNAGVLQSPVSKGLSTPTFPQSHSSYHSSIARRGRKGNSSAVTKATAPCWGTDVPSFLTLCIMLYYPVQSICARYFKESVFHSYQTCTWWFVSSPFSEAVLLRSYFSSMCLYIVLCASQFS